MTERKNYYEHVKHTDDKPFVSESKYDHDGSTIPVNNIEQLERLAMDYLSMKRDGTYYEAFEYMLKTIDSFRSQTRAIQELHNNYTT
mgnify:FL=1